MAVQTNGTVLADRYRVIRRLGSGGAATVFLCEDQRLGRHVAVKRMHADSPEEMAQRLQREARLGASLNHPGLVSVFDTVTYEEGVLVVMEYVDGETLGDALKRGPLGTHRALDITKQLASALDHIHSHGVVHRDVKPANVLLAANGTVKLVDLGIGTAMDGTRITKSGVVLGTPAYMAPEQVEGTTVTPAADIYALGAVVFEMLSGRKARTGRTPIEVAHRAASDPPPDLREAWPEAPLGAARALERAMSRDPRRRQHSAGDLSDELHGALDAPPTVSTRLLQSPPATRQRVPAWAPLLLILAVVGVALFLVLGSGGGGSSSKNSASTHRGHKTTHHRAKPKTTSPSPAAAQTNASATPPAAAQDPIALNNQGKALIDSGQPSSAIPILQKALAAFPPDQRQSINYAYTLFNLADAYLKSGQPQQAIPLLQQRLKFNDQRPVVAAELQQALQAAGQSPGPGNGGAPGKDHGKGHGKDH